MQKDILANTNPNYLHGCHTLDLSDYFEDSPVSIIVKQVKTPSQWINPRRGKRRKRAGKEGRG